MSLGRAITKTVEGGFHALEQLGQRSEVETHSLFPGNRQSMDIVVVGKPHKKLDFSYIFYNSFKLFYP